MQLAEQEKEITELRSLMAQKQDAKQVQRSLLSMLCAIICYTPRLLTTFARAFFFQELQQRYHAARMQWEGRIGQLLVFFGLEGRGCLYERQDHREISFKQICFIFNSIVCHSNIHHSRLFTKRGTMWKQ